MQDERKDVIIYDEQWQSFDEQTECIKSSPCEDECDNIAQTLIHSDIKKERNKKFLSLITIQLIISVLIVFVVFILKSMNSTTYHKLSDYFNDAMKNTLISDSTFEDIDLSSYFDSTQDQAATIDEA